MTPLDLLYKYESYGEYVPVRIKKLHPEAVIPKYQTEGASGFDLHALEDTVVMSGEAKLIKTGLAFQVPHGTELQVRPRSGLSLKSPLRVANSPGTVDSDFTGEVCIIIENTSKYENEPYFIKKGDRIAQGVICPVYQANFIEVEELNETTRGQKGYGSTGQ